MVKQISTYLLITVLFTAVVLPTYLSLAQDCDISICINDIEEDLEGEETESVNELEIKLLFVEHFITSYKHTVIIQKAEYLSKEYNSIHRSLESPPPEIKHV